MKPFRCLGVSNILWNMESQIILISILNWLKEANTRVGNILCYTGKDTFKPIQHINTITNKQSKQSLWLTLSRYQNNFCHPLSLVDKIWRKKILDTSDGGRGRQAGGGRRRTGGRKEGCFWLISNNMDKNLGFSGRHYFHFILHTEMLLNYFEESC